MKGEGGGYGYGDGRGYGYGYGYVRGHGYGYVEGYGEGHEYGYGFGDMAFGDAIELPAGDRRYVLYNKTFGILVLGRQVYTVSYWSRHWREIVEKHNVDVDEDEVDEIFNEIRGLK